MNGQLDGKTALVTGASRGIGRAVAIRLGAEGARVAVHYGSNRKAAEETVAAIEGAGGSAFAVEAEFGRDGDVGKLFGQLETVLAGAPLDILVNNAAVLDPTPVAELSPAQFDRTYDVNVRAPFFVTQRALTLMPDGGRIVNVSSAVTRIASTFVQYTMGKAAIEAFGFTLAQALGPRGITVNSISPGVTDTDMGSWVDSAPGLREHIAGTTALGRLGVPGDIAGVVAFLASDDAGWITGTTIDVSGGMWLGPAAA